MALKEHKKTMERPWEKIGKLTKEHERGNGQQAHR